MRDWVWITELSGYQVQMTSAAIGTSLRRIHIDVIDVENQFAEGTIAVEREGLSRHHRHHTHARTHHFRRALHPFFYGICILFHSIALVTGKQPPNRCTVPPSSAARLWRMSVSICADDFHRSWMFIIHMDRVLSLCFRPWVLCRTPSFISTVSPIHMDS